MRLSDLLKPDRVVIPLTTQSLSAATRTLVERVIEAGPVNDPDKLRSRVGEVGGDDVVALGDRAFLTHYRTDAVNDLIVALGISATPIRREQTEGEGPGAQIVLLMVAPPRMAAKYLQVLGAFASLMRRNDVRDAMLAVSTPQELVALPALREQTVPEELAVRDVMSDRPRTTNAETPLRDAALHMANADVGALPVVDDTGLLVGLLSEKELLVHLTSSQLRAETARRPAAGSISSRLTVRDIMTRKVLCVSPEQPLAEVASLMTNKDVEGLPVVREGKVVGFLTRSDIIRKLIGS